MAALVIDGTYNTRDFGGTPELRVVRSASLDGLTAEGMRHMRDLQLTLVIDLREDAERLAPTSPAPGDDAFPSPVLHNPIYRAVSGPPLTGTLEAIYESLLLTRGRELTDAVAAIADAPGAVLVHCSAGKDRTGLVVALALAAAGVDEGAIVADYIRSAAEVEPFRRENVETYLDSLGLSAADYADALRLHLDSPKAAIRHAFSVIGRFHGAEAYLLAHGLTVEQFSELRIRLGGMRDES